MSRNFNNLVKYEYYNCHNRLSRHWKDGTLGNKNEKDHL